MVFAHRHGLGTSDGKVWAHLIGNVRAHLTGKVLAHVTGMVSTHLTGKVWGTVWKDLGSSAPACYCL